MKDSVLAAMALASVLAGCSSLPITLDPVGPGRFAARSSGREGDLEVFTQTEEYNDGDIIRYPHTDYQVYTSDGRRFKRVWNSLPGGDEFPADVSLPAGSYVVRAWAEGYGTVSVPVVIETNRVTRVVLQPGWRPKGHFDEAELVRFPSGYFVGWKGGP